MHRDLLHQAYSAMRHDLRRTLLTMAGMAWGIATVVLLLSYGNGFGKAIETIFQSFGATAVGVFPDALRRNWEATRQVFPFASPTTTSNWCATTFPCAAT